MMMIKDDFSGGFLSEDVHDHVDYTSDLDTPRLDMSGQGSHLQGLKAFEIDFLLTRKAKKR
jgi:hypothetical protein